MNEHENELKKALAENGEFDAEKEKQTAAEAVSRFNRRLKWTERSGLLFFMAYFAVFVFALVQFATAHTTKAMIAYTIVMLMSYGIGLSVAMLAGLQTMLLRVLKEIKQSQLERLGFTVDRNASSSSDSMVFDMKPWSITWREIIGWKLAFVALALIVMFATLRISNSIWPSDMARFEGAPVTIEAPHVGAPVYYTIYIRMDKGVCHVYRVTPEQEKSQLFYMGEGFINNGTLPPGNSLQLDPQGNTGEYWVRFE